MSNLDKKFQTDEFLLGVCYYPEHWPETIWDDDFRRMKEMGINTVRMGETAWNVMEPEEGKYDFSLFDRALELCERYGLKVILGTPTYAPPAWLTERYPEVLRVDFRGAVMQHGSRRHYNYTSPVYWRLCEGIVNALIGHYKSHPLVIGWQIDNELNCHSDTSFADSDHDAFRSWCHKKYRKLETLNEAWGTAFWAQTYTSWSQIYLPRPTVTYHNPSHLLDFYRFTSDSAIRFAKLQYKIIKEAAPHQFATHNGIFGNIDYRPFTEQTVDFLSYDSYPTFQLMRDDLPVKEKDRLSGKHLSKVRGYSSKYLILEQQAGPGGQTGNGLNNDRGDYLQVAPKPGQIRLWTWQSIAHGADGVLYFRWRTCPYGAETLWHGLNDYGNQPNRRLDEAARIAEETRRLSSLIVGTSVRATALILTDYDNDSNCKIDRHTGFEYWRSEENIYLALSCRHIGVNVLDLKALAEEGVLDGVNLIFIPNAQLLEPKEIEQLENFALEGGTVVFGPRSGYKNRNNHAHQLPFPGVLRQLAGISVEDITMVTDPANQRIQFTEGQAKNAPTLHEVLRPERETVEVLARYTEDYYAGAPAITCSPTGKGAIVYCGTFFTLDNVNALLDMLMTKDGFSPWGNLPSEAEVVYRIDTEQQLYAIVLNYSANSLNLELKHPLFDCLNEQHLYDTHVLEPYGIRWLKLS
ncbi:beta-galactosidase [Paenibacillus luteus]|uniref:beta-galactosidase n=1 Tax=Paenibacillus luteus TaxID=2545753 RepID=UPI001142A0F5|nr:beta-galactosidase [Paenibacillus luteus]